MIMKKTNIRNPLLIQLIVGSLLAVGNLPYAVKGIMEAFQNESIEFVQITHIFVVLAGIFCIIMYFVNKKRYEQSLREAY